MDAEGVIAYVGTLQGASAGQLPEAGRKVDLQGGWLVPVCPFAADAGHTAMHTARPSFCHATPHHAVSLAKLCSPFVCCNHE